MSDIPDSARAMIERSKAMGEYDRSRAVAAAQAELDQLKSGEGPVYDAKKIAPLYGTQPKPVTHASPTADINITYEQLQENISALKKSISTLKSSWDQETKRNIDTINNSWAGNDCSAYTTKLSQMDGKVQNTIQALELLCSTYEKARDMIAQSQRNVSGAVNNL